MNKLKAEIESMGKIVGELQDQLLEYNKQDIETFFEHYYKAMELVEVMK